jgi:hypothetical protein
MSSLIYLERFSWSTSSSLHRPQPKFFTTRNGKRLSSKMRKIRYQRWADMYFNAPTRDEPSVTNQLVAAMYCSICGHLLTTPVRLCRLHYVDMLCALRDPNGFCCPLPLCQTSLAQTHTQLLKFSEVSVRKLTEMESLIPSQEFSDWYGKVQDMKIALRIVMSHTEEMEKYIGPLKHYKYIQ